MRICSVYKQEGLYPEIRLLVILVQGKFFLDIFETLYTFKLVL